MKKRKRTSRQQRFLNSIHHCFICNSDYLYRYAGNGGYYKQCMNCDIDDLDSRIYADNCGVGVFTDDINISIYSDQHTTLCDTNADYVRWELNCQNPRIDTNTSCILTTDPEFHNYFDQVGIYSGTICNFRIKQDILFREAIKYIISKLPEIKKYDVLR